MIRDSDSIESGPSFTLHTGGSLLHLRLPSRSRSNCFASASTVHSNCDYPLPQILKPEQSSKNQQLIKYPRHPLCPHLTLGLSMTAPGPIFPADSLAMGPNRD